MESLTDRERAQALAMQKERAREDAENKQLEQEAAERQLRAEGVRLDNVKTKELFEYCSAQFGGLKLVPTGHELRVERCSSSRLFNVADNEVEFVAFNISHWGSETGDFEGLIQLALANHRNGKYVLITYPDEINRFATLEQFKEKLIDAIASMNQDYLRAVFERVRFRR